MKKGVFWCRNVNNPQLIVVSAECTSDGVVYSSESLSSKSGDNFNHKIEWEKLGRRITEGKPFNYYPRGRVEIKKRKATIYLNPTLNDPTILAKNIKEFELATPQELDTITVKNDGSNHYKYISME